MISELVKGHSGWATVFLRGFVTGDQEWSRVGAGAMIGGHNTDGGIDGISNGVRYGGMDRLRPGESRGRGVGGAIGDF